MDTPVQAPRPSRRRIDIALPAAAVLVVFLAAWRLVDYPLIWYDDGVYLHIPKTLVLHGVYADYSSEGFRYYGPTIGVGPTVLLPIAAVFKVAGIGLLQARLVMVVYLLAAIVMFWRLAGWLGGRRLAWVATALLISSRGVGLIQYGRQVLGEVPGFFFLAIGLLLWFTTWEKSTCRRLAAVGVLLGLAVVTKPQLFIVLAPALTLAWLANVVYYRSAPQRLFLVPGLLVAACFAAWQLYVVAFLGPGAVRENLALYHAATANAAAVFSPVLMKSSVKELLSQQVYLGGLLPGVAYGLFLAIPRDRHGQQWGVLLLLVLADLGWYVLASVGWTRYAFPALALSSLLVARIFCDLTDGCRLDVRALRQGADALRTQGLRAVLLTVLIVMIAAPLRLTARDILFPPFNGPSAMAAYLNEHVRQTALIETCEPEMGFLTDHRYHFLPQRLAYQALGFLYQGKPSPAEGYRFVQEESPDYVLVGWFASWVGMYAAPALAERYDRVAQFGAYQLYALRR